MFKDRFLWKEGDLIFSEATKPLTEDDISRADKAITEVVRAFEKREEERKRVHTEQVQE